MFSGRCLVLQQGLYLRATQLFYHTFTRVHLLAGVLVFARHNRMLHSMERVKLLLALVLGELLAAWRRLHLRRGGHLVRVLGPAGTERLGHCTCGKLWQAMTNGASTVGKNIASGAGNQEKIALGRNC